MSIQDQINNEIKDAMKTRNVDKLASLRAIKSAIMLEATKGGTSKINDKTCLILIAKLVKQRKDSATIFIKQERHDLAEDEMNQLPYLECYLPTQMNEEEVRRIVKQFITEIGALSKSDIGRCMGPLLERLNGRAESSLISKLVIEELS